MVTALVLTIVGLVIQPFAFLQSGATRSRAAGREYGVNLTFAVYQFDEGRSAALEQITRLPSTFSSADEEISYLKEKHKLEDVAVRHVRSVGLLSGETFTDAVLLGPEYMVFTVAPDRVGRGQMGLAINVKYANEPLLEIKNVDLGNFETVIARGARGMFGLKYYVGAEGRQETAPIERTLLVSITPEIVPTTSLRNRPEQLSHPVDEYGTEIRIKEGDRFTPPVALQRVVPKFEAGRHVQGSVLLTGTVTDDGKIINVRVMRSLELEIDQRAIEAFRQYRFSPALLNGKPIRATYAEEISFERQLTRREIQEELEKQREKEQGPKKKKGRRFPWP